MSPKLSAATYCPIRASRGKKVHITSLTSPRKTACGRVCDGWLAATSRVDCDECKLAVHRDARRRRR